MSLRILHVLSSLGQGGIEKWLVNLTAELQRQHGAAVETELLTLLSPGGYYQDALTAMGCRVHHCQLSWRNLPSFVWRLAVVLRAGRYDVVHCHADYLSGLILPVAHSIGVRTRICHVHNTEFTFQAPRPILRHWIGCMLRRMNVWDGGICIGTSSTALDAYLGDLKNRIRHQVSTCGIPCADYRIAVHTRRQALRHSLDWPQCSKVLLHVGRHTEQKNPLFMLEVFAEVLKCDPSVTCVLVGSGPLTSNMQAKAMALGIQPNVRLLGSRDDIPQLMRAADLLLLPSLFEGLGLVVIEAQAVGLRSLVSDVVPPDVEIAEGLVNRLPHRAGAAEWADRVLELLHHSPPNVEESLRLVEASPFNICQSAKSLMGLYLEQYEGSQIQDIGADHSR